MGFFVAVVVGGGGVLCYLLCNQDTKCGCSCTEEHQHRAHAYTVVFSYWEMLLSYCGVLITKSLGKMDGKLWKISGYISSL